MPVYDVPGVYIEEVTGPGVIAGVSTSTAAFVGPARTGTMNTPLRITSFDEFLANFAIQQPDGSFLTYITSPRRFFMADGVRGFFENGGRRAYIVRVGTGKATTWNIANALPETAFRLQAKVEGIAGDNITVQVQAANATGASGVTLTKASAAADTVSGVNLTFAAPPPFVVGDTVTKDQSPEVVGARATVVKILGNSLQLSNTIAGLGNGDTLRLASIIPAQTTLRVDSKTGLYPGTVVYINGADLTGVAVPAPGEPAVIQSVDAAKLVRLEAVPARTASFSLAPAHHPTPTLTSHEFKLIMTAPGSPAESLTNLSMNPAHPGYVFTAVKSNAVNVMAPLTPTTANVIEGLIPTVSGNVAIAVTGANDEPGSVTSAEFEAGLKMLIDIEDVNIVCIPDAASHGEAATIQKDLLDHCNDKKDRFAIFDSILGATPASVLTQRGGIEDQLGFGGLYYPWLRAKDPAIAATPAVNLLIPPSGHLAGVFARSDIERGVHKSPANTDLRGVLGLETVLSDRQQGPLNEAGVNVLRIFPGTAQVNVWGARTVVKKEITDWRYISVRRLLIFIEQSIEEGIRWAVFEPNGLPLWQKLKRTITEFLTRVWRDGALFGATADKAFYVRIDEALNPPSTRALGRLYIEIGVAAVRPAEFIIVRIGLWDGGAEISEQ